MSRIRVAIAAVFLLGAASGHAQDIGTPPVAGTIRPERPFRGLFGEPDDRVGRRDRFDVNFSLAASHDDNVLGDQGLQIPDPRVNTDGFYSVASVDGTYQHTGHRVTMGVGGGSSMRYYADLKDLSAAEHHADVHVDAALGATHLTFAQAAQDTPFFGFRFFPETGSATGGGVATSPQPVRSEPAFLFNTTAGVTQKLSARQELYGGYELHYTDFTTRGSTDLTAHSIRGGYRYQLSSYAGLRAGYGVEQGTYGSNAETGRARLDTIDVGIDYRRPLSFSRRTRVDFSAGTTSASTPLDGRVYRLVGDAGLTHEIGRTWNLRASVRRTSALVDGFRAPVFSNGATVSFGGFINRRLELSTDGAYSSGDIGMTGERNPFDSRTAHARLQFGLNREFALFGEYAYYQYHFSNTDALPLGLSPNLRRNSVRVGLSLFLPVVD